MDDRRDFIEQVMYVFESRFYLHFIDTLFRSQLTYFLKVRPLGRFPVAQSQKLISTNRDGNTANLQNNRTVAFIL